MTHTEQVEKKVAFFDNIIFPSKEDDGIEHVDLNYKEFIEALRSALTEMYSLGVKEGREEMRKEYDENILKLIPKLDGMGAKVDAISENLSKYKLDPL